jgi:hypothetical protein
MDWAAWLESTVDRGGTNERVQRRLSDVWRTGARAHRCSPVAAEEDEPDEAVLEGCSSEHKR